MPPKKQKKGNQNVRGNPAKRIRRLSRRSIEATSAASETSDVHDNALLHQTAEERRSTSTWIIYLQHHRSFHSRHRIAKTPVDSPPSGSVTNGPKSAAQCGHLSHRYNH
uniref:Uncharacterized protein n=1 Tax=Magallana gigas TaxID=29159 RepID=K1QWE9_MAGGI